MEEIKSIITEASVKAFVSLVEKDAGKQEDRLALRLDFAAKAVAGDWNVKAIAVKAFGPAKSGGFDHLVGSVQTWQNDITSCKKLLAHFGSRKAVDAAVVELNNKPGKSSYNAQTLANKLVPKDESAKKVTPPKSAAERRLDLAVKTKVITAAQAAAIRALKV